MKNILQMIAVTTLIMMLAGCSHPFKKPGDELVKSPCEVCHKSPFYVNGKWIEH